MLSNFILNICVYIHVFELLTTQFRKASLSSRQWLMGRSITAQCIERIRLSPKIDCNMHPPPPRLREQHRRGGRKNIRSRGWRGELINAIFWAQMVIILTTLQQMRLLVQDLSKTNLIKIPAELGQMISRTYTLLRALGSEQLLEGRSIFL